MPSTLIFFEETKKPRSSLNIESLALKCLLIASTYCRTPCVAVALVVMVPRNVVEQQAEICLSIVRYITRIDQLQEKKKTETGGTSISPRHAIKFVWKEIHFGANGKAFSGRDDFRGAFGWAMQTDHTRRAKGKKDKETRTHKWYLDKITKNKTRTLKTSTRICNMERTLKKKKKHHR